MLHWNQKGELLYKSELISGSHMMDLVNNMLCHLKGCKPQMLNGNCTMGTLIEQPFRFFSVLVQCVVLKGFKLCKDD